MPDAPAAACASGSKAYALVTTVAPGTPAFPHAMVLTAYFALSLVTGLVCHRRRRSCFRQLDASVGASGPHDFAVRRKALSSSATRVHRIPCPTSVTIAKRPFCMGRDGNDMQVIWVGSERNIFAKRAGQVNVICPSGKSKSFRMPLQLPRGIFCISIITEILLTCVFYFNNR